MKFIIMDFFSKYDQIHRKLVTFTEEIRNGKLHFLSRVCILCSTQIRGIQEVDFPNWCIYFETQKYTWSRLSKFMCLCSNSEIYFLNNVFLFKLRRILEVYFFSAKAKKYKWSIIEVKIKYYWIINKLPFYFFLFL